MGGGGAVNIECSAKLETLVISLLFLPLQSHSPTLKRMKAAGIIGEDNQFDRTKKF